MRFRQRNPPELLELQIEVAGLLHESCIPPGKSVPCAACKLYRFSWPEPQLLSLSSIPSECDIFRLANFTTTIVVTERLVGAVQRLGLEDVAFQELPVR